MDRDFNSKLHLEEHHMVRIMRPSGEAVWCRKCSGFAWYRLVPKLMSRCRPAKMDTKETRNMLNIIRKLEPGVVPDSEREGWTTGNNGFVMLIISVPLATTAKTGTSLVSILRSEFGRRNCTNTPPNPSPNTHTGNFLARSRDVASTTESVSCCHEQFGCRELAWFTAEHETKLG